MHILAKNLKRFRIAKDLTQEQATEYLGVRTQSVSRWEYSTALPDVMMLPKIAALYCITINAQIAESLEKRGFDAKVNWPRTLAIRCWEKVTISKKGKFGKNC